MKRLPLIAAAVFALTASAPIMSLIATPAAAQGWRGEDEDMNYPLRDALAQRIRDRQELRDLLLDRLRTRQDLRDFLMEHLRDEGGGLRGRLRERLGAFREGEDEDYGGLHGRLLSRIAERRGFEGGGCYFLTRSLRDEDGSLLVIVRRRLCRD